MIYTVWKYTIPPSRSSLVDLYKKRVKVKEG